MFQERARGDPVSFGTQRIDLLLHQHSEAMLALYEDSSNIEYSTRRVSYQNCPWPDLSCGKHCIVEASLEVQPGGPALQSPDHQLQQSNLGEDFDSISVYHPFLCHRHRCSVSASADVLRPTFRQSVGVEYLDKDDPRKCLKPEEAGRRTRKRGMYEGSAKFSTFHERGMVPCKPRPV